MEEFFDIYDENRRFLGRSENRKTYKFKKGEYHIVADGYIFNSNNQLLITRRAPNKTFPYQWEGSGGSVVAGEKSIDGIIREIKEEIGLDIEKNELVFYDQYKIEDEKSPRFRDVYIIKKDVDIKDLVLQEDEVMDAKWVTLDEYKAMLKNNEIVPILNFYEEDFVKAIDILNK